MLKSSLLFVAIMVDVSARYELTTKDLIEVATEVASQQEFSGNPEIPELIRSLASDQPLVHLRKIAYKCGLHKEV